MTLLATGSRRRLGMPFAAALAVGAVVLAGCQSDAEPAVGTPSAPSGSPSASPSSSSPTPSPSESVGIPAAAREKSEKGAEAFVRHFVAQSALAWTTPDPALITIISDPECESCTSLATTARELQAKGRHYSSAPISVVSTEALTGDATRQNVAATIAQHATHVVDETGAVVSSDRADTLERTFLLYWKEGAWLVGGIA